MPEPELSNEDLLYLMIDSHLTDVRELANDITNEMATEDIRNLVYALLRAAFGRGAILVFTDPTFRERVETLGFRMGLRTRG